MSELTLQQKYDIMDAASLEADEWAEGLEHTPSNEVCAAKYFDLIIEKYKATQPAIDTRQFKPEPSAFRLDWPAHFSIGMDRFYGNDGSPRMARRIEFAPDDCKPDVVPLYEMISKGE